MSPHVKRWIFRLLAASVICGALAYIPYRIYGSDGYVRYRAMSQELHRLEAQNEGLRRSNAELRRDVLRLRNDLDAIGTVARDELGMVGESEIVIQIDGPRGQSE